LKQGEKSTYILVNQQESLVVIADPKTGNLPFWITVDNNGDADAFPLWAIIILSIIGGICFFCCFFCFVFGLTLLSIWQRNMIFNGMMN
jgi:hypothetical protein